MRCVLLPVLLPCQVVQVRRRDAATDSFALKVVDKEAVGVPFGVRKDSAGMSTGEEYREEYREEYTSHRAGVRKDSAGMELGS